MNIYFLAIIPEHSQRGTTGEAEYGRKIVSMKLKFSNFNSALVGRNYLF